MTTKISFRSSSIYLLLSSTFPSSIYNSRRKVERIERHPSTGIQLSHPFPRTFAAQKFDPSSTRDPQKAANNRPNLSSLDPSLSLSLCLEIDSFRTFPYLDTLENWKCFERSFISNLKFLFFLLKYLFAIKNASFQSEQRVLHRV